MSREIEAAGRLQDGDTLPYWKDARQRQTQAAIRRVVIEEASLVPSTELSVTEVAVRAGINRSTFYKHTHSPAQFLQAAMTQQLSEQVRLLEKGEGITFQTVVQAVGRHLDAHRRLYETSLLDASAASSLFGGVELHFARTLYGSSIGADEPTSVVAAAAITAAFRLDISKQRPIRAEQALHLLEQAALSADTRTDNVSRTHAAR